MSKFHIGADGKPGRCRAEKGNCPYGGEGDHYKSFGEAQHEADRRHFEEHGTGFEPSTEVTSYYHSLKSVKEFNKPIVYGVTTRHYAEDRQEREAIINTLFDEGKPVDKFLLQDDRGRPQLQEIYDNGKIVVYCPKSFKKVTVLEPRAYRLNDIYAKAEKEPPSGLLDTANANHAFLNKYNVGQQSTNNNADLDKALKEKGKSIEDVKSKITHEYNEKNGDNYKKTKGNKYNNTKSKKDSKGRDLPDFSKKKKKNNKPRGKKPLKHKSADSIFDKLNDYNTGKKTMNFD